MKDVKWWALAHEWYRDIIKVARAIKTRFAQEDWFRVGGDHDSIKWRRESTSFGWVKTGSRTSEDFTQQDWFRVAVGQDRIGDKVLFRVGDFYRSGDWGTIKHLRSGSMTIKNRKTGGWDPRHTSTFRLAHTCPF